MVDRVSNRVDQPVQNDNTEQKKRGCCSRCMRNVCRAVKEFFYALLQAFLFVVNPTIFAISFIAGIVTNKYMSAAVERIKKIWKAATCGVVMMGLIGAFLSLPITLATASWASATHLSCRLVKKAEQKYPSRPIDV